MSNVTYAKIAQDGLWNQNPGLVQILGLCPLLAVSSTSVNALGLGLATMLVLALTNGAVAAIRDYVPNEIRIPVFVLLIAAIVTAVELAMNAYLHDLYKILGIFIPLIVTNCNVLARAEAFASKNPVGKSVLDGLMMGLGFALVLLVLGAVRELIGYGTIMDHAELMFGSAGEWMKVTVIEDYRGYLLAILPPGAFIALGLLIALKNMIENRRRERAASAAPVASAAT